MKNLILTILLSILFFSCFSQIEVRIAVYAPYDSIMPGTPYSHYNKKDKPVDLYSLDEFDSMFNSYVIKHSIFYKLPTSSEYVQLDRKGIKKMKAYLATDNSSKEDFKKFKRAYRGSKLTQAGTFVALIPVSISPIGVLGGITVFGTGTVASRKLKHYSEEHLFDSVYKYNHQAFAIK